MDFAAFLLSITVFLGTTMSLLLIFIIKPEKQRSNIILGILILIPTLYLYASFLHKFGLLEQFPHFIRLRNVLSLAFGPLMYFYVKICIQKDLVLTKKHLAHFVPLALNFVYVSSFVLQSGEYKMEAFLATINKGDLGEPVFIPLARCIYNIIYWVINIRIISLYKKQLSNEVSNIDEGYNLWLTFFASTLFFPIVTLTLFVVFGHNSITLELVYLTFFILIVAIYIFLFLKPAVIHSFPYQIQIEDEEIGHKKVQDESRKYEASKLKIEQKEKYLKTLKEYMQKNKPYCEPDLTISKLSEQVNIPKQYLSQIINEELGTHFLGFINKNRIEEAKSKLLDDSLSHYTIEAIAYDVGFNSKSAFYASFKKHTNTTPSTYRRSFQKASSL